MITRASIPPWSTTNDPIAFALRTLADAGIAAEEVERCPDATCDVCAHPGLPRAA